MATQQPKVTNPAPAPSTAIAAPIDPALLGLMAQPGESGFEGATAQDFSIPFLALLQKLSPQCDDSKDEYIEGAKPGQFYNSATGQLFDEVTVIPCYHKRAMVEWKPDRGGFVQQHEPGIELSAGVTQNDKGQFVLPNGNLLVDTRYFGCLQLDEDGNATPVIVAMSSTQIKVAKQWMSRMQALKVEGPHGKFTPPMFSHAWTLNSINKSNEKGSWKLYNVKGSEPVNTAELFNTAKETRKTFTTATIAPPPLLEAGEDNSAGGKM